jgi:hypothetical protein
MLPSKPCLWLILLLTLAAGCGGPRDGAVPVRGTVTNAGQPLAVKGRDVGLGYVELHFYRIADDGTMESSPDDAAVDDLGNFSVRGRDGNGLRPGKYKITVRQLDPAPNIDKLKGRFDLKNTRIVREVTGDDEIHIDVSRPEG